MTPYTIWCPQNSWEALNELLPGVYMRPEPTVARVMTKKGLPTLPPGALLMMGTPFLNYLKDAGLVKRNATLTACREQFITLGDTRLMLTYDPVLTRFERERVVDVLWDLNLCSRLARTGSLLPTIGDYEWVEDFDAFEAAVESEGLTRIALDLETVGLDPWAPEGRILTVSLTAVAGRSAVYRVPTTGKPPKAILKALRRLLCSPHIRVTGANLKFDCVWLAHHWQLTGINQTFDTHLAGSLLDENRSNALEIHAKIYTSMGGYDTEFNRTHDKDRMDLALEADPDGFLNYAGGDTDACFRVTHVQRRLLKQDERLTRFFQKILLPASKVFTKVETRGVLVDRARYKQLESECQAELNTLTKQAFSHIPRRLILKYADNLSPTRPALLREFLFTRRGLNLKPLMLTPAAKQAYEDGEDVDPVENAATSAEHLQRFIDHPKAGPFIAIMEQYASAAKMMSTYIVGFQKHIRSDDRFHPAYRLGRGSSSEDPEGGAVTGRLSATDPAYQTIVKRGKWAKPLRSVYPCPPGHGIAKLDFGQGELRIMGILAKDPTMLHAYRTGFDLHALTAAAMMGLTIKQFMAQPEDLIEENRRAAKAVNFGLLYGMKPPGLVDYARKSYGVVLTLDQAEKYSDAFFETYDRLLPYHAYIKGYAHKHGMVRNPLGRIRHLPLIHSMDNKTRSLAERQAINSPIQSCLSDMMLMALVEIDRRWPDLWIFGMTHDSCEMYLPLDIIETRVVEVQEVLQNLPLADFGWEPPINFVADIELTTTGTLADVKKWKQAA